MGIIKKVIGAHSKYDKTLPYSYMAKHYIVEGNEDLCQYYYGDTICSLLEHLTKHDIRPSETELYSMYTNYKVKLDKKICSTNEDEWLLKPLLCVELEKHYKETKDELYKGHVATGDCSFDDREERIL